MPIGFFVGAAPINFWNASDIFLAEGLAVHPCRSASWLFPSDLSTGFWCGAACHSPTVTLGGTLGAIAGLLGATVFQFLTCSRQEVESYSGLACRRDLIAATVESVDRIKSRATLILCRAVTFCGGEREEECGRDSHEYL